MHEPKIVPNCWRIWVSKNLLENLRLKLKNKIIMIFFGVLNYEIMRNRNGKWMCYPSIFIREKKIFVDLDWKAKIRIFLIKFFDIIPNSNLH